MAPLASLACSSLWWSSSPAVPPERKGTGRHSPLGVEDAVERGPSPVLARQGEDGPQVVKGDVALAEGALQPRFLEGGPLFLQGPGSTQVSLREERPGQGETRVSAFVTANQG